MGGAPPPPLGAAPQGAKNPEKFGPKRAGFGRVEATEDHAQEGGGRGSRPLPDPALRGGRRAPARPPSGSSPSRPPQARDQAISEGAARRVEASDAASARSSAESIATRGSGRPALGMGMTGISVWASVYGQVVQAERTTSPPMP